MYIDLSSVCDQRSVICCEYSPSVEPLRLYLCANILVYPSLLDMVNPTGLISIPTSTANFCLVA